MHNRLLEYSPEAEMFEAENLECATEADAGVLRETEEIGLTLELLAIRSERDLNHFLIKLIRGVSRHSAHALQSQMLNAIANVLHRTAKAILRIAGGQRGGSIGQRLAPVASRLFALELEGLSNEDREFETARRCVRFLSESVANAATVEAGTPLLAAQKATTVAAQKYAPGLLNLMSTHPGSPDGDAQSGQWLRNR
jgi:hypothetical protein